MAEVTIYVGISRPFSPVITGCKIIGLLLNKSCGLEQMSVSGRYGTGSCANPPTQSGFELSRFLGQWYGQVEYSAMFNMGVSCSRTSYTMKPNGHLKLYNQGYYRLIGQGINVEGDAYTTNSDPATLIVSFFRLLPSAPYKIVETDYENYSVIYSCSKMAFMKSEVAWILTRTPEGLPPNELSSLYSRLQSYGIDTDHFDTITQTNCPI